jgi:hypothetical protein
MKFLAKLKKWIGREKSRAYLYRVAFALLVAAQGFRWLSVEESDLIANVLTAVLGVGASALAVKNTSTNPLQEVTGAEGPPTLPFG